MHNNRFIFKCILKINDLFHRLGFSTFAFLFIFFGLSSFSIAAPISLTYQGRILKADGTPLEYGNVSFIFQITDPSGQCVIYQEQINGINMTNSAGVFDVPIGTATIQFPLGGTATVLDVFNNSSSYTCGSCSSANGVYTCANGSSTYTATANDIRKLRVSFYDGTGWRLITPDNTIHSVPFAAYSLSAQKLGTNSASDFLLKAGLPTCGAGTFLTWSGSALTCGAVSGSSGGTVTAVTSSNSYLSVATGTSTPALTVNVGTIAGTVAAGDDSRITGAFQTSTSLGGDLTGTLPNPAVSKINGVSVSSAVAGDDGKFLKFVNGSGWQPHFVKLSELKNATGAASAFNVGTCTSAQTLVWSSLTDQFSCQDISLPASKVTGLATVATSGAYSDLTGTPTLNSLLPTQTGQNGKFLTTDGTNTSWATSSSQWTTSGSNIYYNTGNVGIGTTTPVSTAALTVNGAISTNSTSIILGDTSGNARNAISLDIQASRSAVTQVASGAQAIALGMNNTANSTKATAIGYSNTAGSGNSEPVAIGVNNVATGNWYGSTAIGVNNLAKGSGSSAIGVGNSVNGSYDYGTAIGYGNLVGYHGGTTIGRSNSTGGFPNAQQIAIGVSNAASADQSIAIGRGITNTIANSLQIGPSNTAKVMIDSSGNVGIGTISPAAKLDVTDTDTTTSAIIVPRAGAFTGTTVNGMVRYNSTSNLFEFFQNGSWVNYTTVSDARLKTNVVPVTSTQGLDIVNQLNPVFYDWDKKNPRTETFGTQHQVGFIAQEVEKVLPEVVNVGKDSYRSVEYGKIVSVVVAAVKELYNKFLGHDEQLATQSRQIASVQAQKADKTELQALKAENAAKDKEIADLKARLERIEKMLQSK